MSCAHWGMQMRNIWNNVEPQLCRFTASGESGLCGLVCTRRDVVGVGQRAVALPGSRTFSCGHAVITLLELSKQPF